MPGFFGTRASLLVDLAITTFVLMPFALLPVIRLAKRGEHRRHRAAQLALFAIQTLAVVLLEVDIRLEGGSAAIAGRAVQLDGAAVRVLLLGHIAIATTTWVGWLTLLVRSARRYSGKATPPLPGPFSRTHRRWGRWVWLGVFLTSASGVVLYVAAFT